MELTYEEAQEMMEVRFREFPEIGAIVHAPTFSTQIADIAAFHAVPTELISLIEHEVRVVLALYAPITELAQNIAESTGLSHDICESIATMVRATVLEPIYDDLIAYAAIWDVEKARAESMPEVDPTLKERLELRPHDMGTQAGAQAGEGRGVDSPEEMARPLTREELLSALSAKRTMASDIAAVKRQESGDGTLVGYASVQNGEQGEKKE